MKLEEAKKLADEYNSIVKDKCFKIAFVGSIRRKKLEVNDIDIVIMPKWISPFFVPEFIPQDAEVIKSGIKLLSFIWKDTQFDVYFATENTYETLVLIRTGSAEHNIKLCSIAKSKGWKLKANGIGLLDKNDCIISNTEIGILEALLGKYIPPEERE